MDRTLSEIKGCNMGLFYRLHNAEERKTIDVKMKEIVKNE